MDDEAPTLRRIRTDLDALGSTRSPEAEALRRVLGWAEHAEFKEGAPFEESRVPSLVRLAVERFTNEASTCAGGGDAVKAAAHRQSAAALAPYL
ncbi:hypothetical protein AB6N24_16905 [Cellulomonas sp. 179-A 4D5 NHS]|uniref:hypothetical protein n=1 Tax=Cellulomonas sp. 179-A 4D5 NHS TaxID=3142378 RepID=UPI00399FB8F9